MCFVCFSEQTEIMSSKSSTLLVLGLTYEVKDTRPHAKTTSVRRSFCDPVPETTPLIRFS
jgi:hypothetical protein